MSDPLDSVDDDDLSGPSVDRRTTMKLLSAAGMTGVGALAGCTGGGGDGEGTDTTQTTEDSSGGGGGSGGGGDGEDSDQDSGPSGEKYGGTLQTSWRLPEMNELDPIIMTHGFDIQHMVNIYNGLLKQNADNEIVGDLAKDWTVDGASMTFSLREDVYFHERDGKYGDNLTAEHIKFALKRPQQNKQSPAYGRANALKPVDDGGVEIVDDYTITLNWKNQLAPALSFLTRGQGRMSNPVHPQALEDMGHEEFMLKPIATGPFKVMEHSVGESLSLQRHENYHETDEDGNQLPYLDGYEVNLIPEASVATSAIRSGDIDFLQKIPEQSVEQVQNTDGVMTAGSELSDWRPIEWNGCKEPFGPLYEGGRTAESTTHEQVPELPKGEFPDGLDEDTLKFRKGLGAVVDQERYVNEALFGKAKPAYGPLNPNFYPKRSTEEKPTSLPDWQNGEEMWKGSGQEFELEKGKELIRESGNEGVTFTISARKQDLRVSKQARLQMNESGVVNCELNQVTGGELGKQLDNLSFDTWIGGSSHASDPEENLWNHYNPPEIAGWNQSCFNDVEAREWLVEQRETMDREERAEILNKIEDRVLNTMATKYLFHSIDYRAWQDHVKGVPEVAGLRPFHTVWLDE